MSLNMIQGELAKGAQVMARRSKNITKGTAKARVLRLINHAASESMIQESVLTDDEIKALISSFETPAEVETYERYRKLLSKAHLYLMTLSQFQLSYMVTLGELERLLLVQFSWSNVDVLSSAIESLGLRVMDVIPKNKHDYIAEMASMFGPEKRVASRKKKTARTRSLEKRIRERCEEAEQLQLQLKTGIRVFEDFVEEKKFRVKIFHQYIRQIETGAKTSLETTRSKEAEISIRLISDPDLRERVRRQLIAPAYDLLGIDEEVYGTLRRGYFE